MVTADIPAPPTAVSDRVLSTSGVGETITSSGFSSIEGGMASGKVQGLLSRVWLSADRMLALVGGRSGCLSSGLSRSRCSLLGCDKSCWMEDSFAGDGSGKECEELGGADCSRC